MRESIGKNLRLIRIGKGFSQGDIEKRTGLLRSYLSRVENGHTVPSLETLDKIAAALEVRLPDLLDDPQESAATTVPRLTDKGQLRFWKLMRRHVPKLRERDRRLLAGLARKMAEAR